MKNAFHAKLDEFFSYCHEEGWCLEYDGADPGYLSATISFMAKLRRHYQDERFMPFFEKAVEFSSYFVYPNGHYGGTTGSRQTLHFYPHGYELLAREIPLAAWIADRMLEGLKEGALVPPEIQGERYFVYRIPELLLSYIDYGERPSDVPPLPYEQEPFTRYFPGAKMYVEKRPRSYTVVNAAKGGVVKHFDLTDDILRLNNCGIMGITEYDKVFTSQWIDEHHEIEQRESEIIIRGHCHKMPSKVFNPLTFLCFRVFILLCGWNQELAYSIKGLIRKILMLGSRQMPIRFIRTIKTSDSGIEVSTQIDLEESIMIKGLQIGDEFPARYVPQSRYFQPQELDVRGYVLTPAEIDTLNIRRNITVLETYNQGDEKTAFQVIKND